MQKSMRPRRVLLAGAAIASLAGAGAAWATIPSANGTIQGCYHAQKGSLRVVDSPSKCKSKEVPIKWNQTGPQGPAGAPGAKGETGDKGDKGDPGPAGAGLGSLVVRSSAPVTVPSAGPINRQARAFCQAGEKVISGGADVTGIPGGTRRGEYFTFVVRDHPLPEPPTGQTPNGWLVEVTNTSAQVGSGAGEDSVLRAHVVCAA
jgi:hypothetical protein